MARSLDAEISQSFLNMTRAYRSQAEVLKVKKKIRQEAALTKIGRFEFRQYSR
jgi:hypothetical protein